MGAFRSTGTHSWQEGGPLPAGRFGVTGAAHCARVVKIWSRSDHEARSLTAKPRSSKAPEVAANQRTTASSGDGLRPNRTQEVAGSSSASSTKKASQRRGASLRRSSGAFARAGSGSAVVNHATGVPDDFDRRRADAQDFGSRLELTYATAQSSRGPRSATVKVLQGSLLIAYAGATICGRREQARPPA